HPTSPLRLSLFFFTATSTTAIYTLSLHDALPICRQFDQGRSDSLHAPDCYRIHAWLVTCLGRQRPAWNGTEQEQAAPAKSCRSRDRKSTRLNSSHVAISYAVFCLKKKKNRLKSHR